MGGKTLERNQKKIWRGGKSLGQEEDLLSKRMGRKEEAQMKGPGTEVSWSGKLRSFWGRAFGKKKRPRSRDQFGISIVGKDDGKKCYRLVNF